MPAQLDDVPSPTHEVALKTGDELPVFGMYEPQIEDGCMNYLLGGAIAPPLWESDGVNGTGNAINDSWRLIWQDTRYLDGAIPDQERRYFPAPR